MIEKESCILPIGYGAMLTEGFVPVMALIAASVLIPSDYFAINTKLSFDTLASRGFPVAEVDRLSAITITFAGVMQGCRAAADWPLTFGLLPGKTLTVHIKQWRQRVYPLAAALFQ